MIRRSEVDCPANVRLVACRETVSHHDCGTLIRKECAAGALNSFSDCTGFGNGSEADIDGLTDFKISVKLHGIHGMSVPTMNFEIFYNFHPQS